MKSVLGINRFFSSPLFCQETAGHYGLVGIGIEQEADSSEGKNFTIFISATLTPPIGKTQI